MCENVDVDLGLQITKFKSKVFEKTEQKLHLESWPRATGWSEWTKNFKTKMLRAHAHKQIERVVLSVFIGWNKYSGQSMLLEQPADNSSDFNNRRATSDDLKSTIIFLKNEKKSITPDARPFSGIWYGNPLMRYFDEIPVEYRISGTVIRSALANLATWTNLLDLDLDLDLDLE